MRLFALTLNSSGLWTDLLRPGDSLEAVTFTPHPYHWFTTTVYSSFGTGQTSLSPFCCLHVLACLPTRPLISRLPIYLIREPQGASRGFRKATEFLNESNRRKKRSDATRRPPPTVPTAVSRP